MKIKKTIEVTLEKCINPECGHEFKIRKLGRKPEGLLREPWYPGELTFFRMTESGEFPIRLPDPRETPIRTSTTTSKKHI